MNDQRWQHIERLLDHALDLEPSARQAWLDALKEAPDVVTELTAILRAHDHSEGILDKPLGGDPGQEIRTRLSSALADRYHLEDEIGRGGAAVVFRAREIKHDRPVVLKVLKPEAAAVFGKRRFLDEVHIAAQLSHPHILALIDSGEADGLLFYVMPYVGGYTLRARLDAGAIPVDAAMTLLRDVADALAYAHSHRVVHRDLKPENVLCVNEHAFLMDFGIAKLRDVEARGRHTASGVAVGTVGYMAPEQAEGKEVDQRADIYAWGLLAREVFARAGGVPRHLAPLIDACTARDPNHRPSVAGEILQQLGGSGRSTEVASRKSMRAGLVWLGATVVIVVGIVTLAVIRAQRGEAGASGLAQPVAVAVLSNETGDSALATWGRLAGDWITQGLQETGLVTVVPWPYALDASLQYEGRGGDRVRTMRAETRAGTVITGSYYLVGDSIRFQAEITDASSGRLIAAPQPVAAPRDSPQVAVRLLRDRLMGTFAVQTNDATVHVPGLLERPPTYDAYRAFDRGVQLHLAQDYRLAALEFREAFVRDTAFVIPLIYAALSHWNTHQRDQTDSILKYIRARQGSLDEYHEMLVQYIEALMQGDGERALRAIRRAAAIAPASRAVYNYALTAIATNRPREALTALTSLDPDRGSMRGWPSYWTQRTHAHHLTGDHRGELEAARAMRRRYPDHRAAIVLETRALAALGRTDDIDSLLVEVSALPPNVYWSQGGAMVVAGEELMAHGHPEAGETYLERAVHWLANQLTSNPDNWNHRYWLGSTLYDLGRYEEAAPYFESLVADYPERFSFRALLAVTAAREGDRALAERLLDPPPPAYEYGDLLVARVRIAAAVGDTDRAIDLLSQGLRQGLSNYAWLHASGVRDLAVLEADPRYRRLKAGWDGPAMSPLSNRP